MHALSDKMAGASCRRRFLARASAIGAGSLLGLPWITAAEPSAETTKIRLVHSPSICFAPEYVAEDLLRQEGFSEIEYVPAEGGTLPHLVASGQADVMMESTPTILPLIDTDRPILILAGIHAGCYELFVKNGIRGVRDLKDRTVAISAMGSASHMFIASMVAYVGMNPQREIHWLEAGTTEKAMRAFMEGRADAFIAFPPQPQQLRAQKVGKVIVDTKEDRPWSQYYCCVVAANRDFVGKHPVATKRVLRAMLKATDVCAENPMRAARYLVTKGYEPHYELALEALSGIPYNRWRSSDPQDTVRFHALRLHEAGMIKSNPEKIIAQGTDWRFLNELKKELKA